jgi:hypothetical protein
MVPLSHLHRPNVPVVQSIFVTILTLLLPYARKEAKGLDAEFDTVRKI